MSGVRGWQAAIPLCKEVVIVAEVEGFGNPGPVLCLKATERMMLFCMRHFSFILRNLGTSMVENKMGTLSEVGF